MQLSPEKHFQTRKAIKKGRDPRSTWTAGYKKKLMEKNVAKKNNLEKLQIQRLFFIYKFGELISFSTKETQMKAIFAYFS
jgi:hypothetical protein